VVLLHLYFHIPCCFRNPGEHCVPPALQSRSGRLKFPSPWWSVR